MRGNRVKSLAKILACEFTGIDQPALFGKGGLVEVYHLARSRRDDLFDRQAVFPGEFIIALIVRRHRHHRAGAVTHQYEVGGPHRHLFAGDRMDGHQAGGHALLFHRFKLGLGGTGLLAFFDEGGKRGIVFRRRQGQRMFTGDRDIGHAHQRVGAGGEDAQRFSTAFHAKIDLHTFGTTDPVALHRAHLFWPAVEFVQIVQQLLGVGGDLHEVLRDLLALDHGVATPAAAIDHLLVGEYGLIVRAPVHGGGLFVDQSLLKQLREQPLFPLVIIGGTGRQLAAPVVTKAQALELTTHVVDILFGPLGGRDAVFDRGIFSRQTKGIPAHRL